jgi:hypothetical protein
MGSGWRGLEGGRGAAGAPSGAGVRLVQDLVILLNGAGGV